MRTMMKFRVTACVMLFFALHTLAYPEQGEWKFTFDKNRRFHGVGRSMYSDTGITVVSASIRTQHNKEIDVKVGWMLRYSPCAVEYSHMDESASGKDLDELRKRLRQYYEQPDMLQIEQVTYSETSYKTFTFKQTIDENSKLHFPDKSSEKPINVPMKNFTTPESQDNAEETNPKKDKAPAKEYKNVKETQEPDKDAAKDKGKAADDAEKSKDTKEAGKKTEDGKKTRKRRDATAKPKEPTTSAAKKPPVKVVNNSTKEFVRAWMDGMYLFILNIEPVVEDYDYSIDVIVRMSSKRGKISALDWPLLVFYGVMGLVYMIYGVIWIVLLACNWRDLLRLQFWVGAVIVLGMLEKAVFFAEYESIAKTGVSVRGALIFAELVSAVKRALSRMLVIIVSLGFGIIRPRLGQALTKVLAVGGLYFILAAIEGCMRATRPMYDTSRDLLFIGIPLSVTDAGICWWIFSSLVQTIRTLRLRRNIVKLSLYRHFTNTLIFAILASVAFMIWSISQHKFKHCITDWKELWVDDAFWHLLFCVILAVIMVLWRPTINNQRYAFSPLLDAADDEEEEDIIMNDAFAGMKLRGSKTQANGSPKQPEKKNSDDDLKWVEENIPTSIVDKAIPSLLDSDEEIMTTKFEMSKMD